MQNVSYYIFNVVNYSTSISTIPTITFIHLLNIHAHKLQRQLWPRATVFRRQFLHPSPCSILFRHVPNGHGTRIHDELFSSWIYGFIANAVKVNPHCYFHKQHSGTIIITTIATFPLILHAPARARYICYFIFIYTFLLLLLCSTTCQQRRGVIIITTRIAGITCNIMIAAIFSIIFIIVFTITRASLLITISISILLMWIENVLT